ncbi:alpha/beta hydrolase [Azospirillum picis]|uniref:Pimeloyl-ACP methyl ester carboxylesterase n=1 Tax=Azospirillum picis TaxID=488438 RepID=A0ABU0MRS9_9PROT|nr:alpha/beta fold hydrolase [Azospirillum picis]MBP2302570.1 pimeloyl-ACP methyl ester carboxylesterase [Azospirillum picis]MDQ0536188.1 pimeloyl-ACP methyl ester carboxylesterase [Azospirillum picis]
MSNLEIISRRPAAVAKTPPLLFVHGAFSGAWIWDAKFLPWFADRGWEAHAVSLRGHGGSEGRDRLHGFGIADYVEDVLEAAGRLSAPPVLIGHSMGGIVVQRALARRRFPAGVLMASAPPYGLWSSTMGLAWRSPYVYQQMSMLMAFGEDAIDPEAVRRAMFSDAMPRVEAAKYESFLQEESRRVLLDIGGWVPFPVLPPRDVPVLVMGAEEDLLFPRAEVVATAAALGTKPVFMPGMGHAMMLERDWVAAAETVEAWVERTVAAAAA